MKINEPIGIVDSGVGGFSILASLQKKFPQQNFIYLCDEAHFPYSEKSVVELQQIGKQAVEKLLSLGCKTIVIACNTLTVTALQFLRETYPSLKFVGTVPAVKPAAEEGKDTAHIVVLATKNTAESTYLKNLVQPFEDRATFSLLGSTKLVEAIEHWNDVSIIAELTLLLRALEKEKPITAVVLGCTHFAFIEHHIAAVLSTPTQFYEPSAGIARQLEKVVTIATADISKPTVTTIFLSTNPLTSSQTLEDRFKFLTTQL